MTELFVDTSFIIAVNCHDQYHAEAVALSERYEGQLLVTTAAVLIEVGNALAKKFKAEAVAVIEDFWAADEVTVVSLDDDLLGEGFDLYKRYTDKSWGMVDCISFVVMKQRGMVDALTADHDYRQVGSNPLLGSS